MAKKATKENTNALARALYAARGYKVEPGYDFSAAHHPQEVAAWNEACGAFKFITGQSLSPVDGEARLRERFAKTF